MNFSNGQANKQAVIKSCLQTEFLPILRQTHESNRSVNLSTTDQTENGGLACYLKGMNHVEMGIFELVKKFFPQSTLMQTKKADESPQWCLVLSKQDIDYYYKATGSRQNVGGGKMGRETPSAPTRKNICCVCVSRIWWLFKLSLFIFLISWGLFTYFAVKPRPSGPQAWTSSQQQQQTQGQQQGGGGGGGKKEKERSRTDLNQNAAEAANDQFVSGKITYTEYATKVRDLIQEDAEMPDLLKK